jgi:two-component system response regulator (stage 0 sporulation protein F)
MAQKLLYKKCSAWGAVVGTEMKRYSLLLVEDEKSVLESLFEALKNDYDVIKTESGKEAITAIKKNDVDAVILDLRLPGIDGLDILKIIKNIERGMPVIIISGAGSASAVREGFKCGAYDYFDKPFDIGELKRSIRNAVRDAYSSCEQREKVLSVDLELLIQDAVDETMRHHWPLNNALQNFRERYIDLVEQKVLGAQSPGCKFYGK